MRSCLAISRIKLTLHFSFLVVLGVIWVNELFDLPHLLGLGPATPANVIEAALETVVIAAAWFISAMVCRRLSSKISVLEGILPICSHCRKVRWDAESWQQVEAYVSEHSDALFSHSICPECMKELYPDVARDVLKEGGDNE